MRLVDTREYQTGGNFERQCASWLLGHGYSVVRVRYGGIVAPTLSLWNQRVRLPDLQFMHAELGQGWAECKWKATCGWFEVRHMRTTGVDFACWKDYCAVERITGVPVWILFGHREQNEVRRARATDPASFSGSGDGAKMRYWSVDSLPLVATYEEVEARSAHTPSGPERPLFEPDSRAQQSLPGMTAL